MFITIKEVKGEHYNSRDYFKGLKKLYSYYSDYEIIRMISEASFNVVYMDKEYKDQNWINIYAMKDGVTNTKNSKKEKKQ